jgi:ubiquinone biosynthesis protein
MHASKKLAVYRELVRLVWKYGRLQLLGSGEHPSGDDQTPDPEDLARDLESLGPAFVKIGQLLSSQLDGLAKPYADALERLQTQVHPFPFSDVRQIVHEELGAAPEDLFASFKAEPIAAGSLAQVHDARLRSGARVAVKVQRPDARTLVREHMAGLSHVASLLDAYYGNRYGLVEILDHTRRLVERELDFETERRNLGIIGAQLAQEPLLHVPAPVPHLSTGRVLTMEFVDGTPVKDSDELGPDEAHQLAERLFVAYLDQFLIHGVVHADPHPGNVLVTRDRRLALIDLGMIEHIAPRMRGNLLQLALMIINGEGERTAELATKLGKPQRDYDYATFKQELSERVVAYHVSDSARLRFGQVLLDVANVCGKYGVTIPPLIAIVGKALLNLDQTARLLDPEFDSKEVFAREKNRLIAQFATRTTPLDEMVVESIEMKQLLRDAPRRLNSLLENLSRDDKGLKIDAVDERQLLDGIEKIANRITYGLVIAALLVSGTLMMQLDEMLTSIVAWTMLVAAISAVGLVLLVMFVNRHRA